MNLLQLAIQLTPELIGDFRTLFKKQYPDAVEPTDEEVFAAFELAFQSSLAKDDAWLAAHPPTQS